MAAKYMQLVLTPAVQQAQDKYFGKHQVVKNAPRPTRSRRTKLTSSPRATVSIWRP